MTLPDRSRYDVNKQSTLIGVSSADGETPVSLWVDPTTHSLVSGGQLITASFDYIAVTYPSDTVETYTYKLGGSGGTTVATVTVTYTASDKTILSSVEKT